MNLKVNKVLFFNAIFEGQQQEDITLPVYYGYACSDNVIYTIGDVVDVLDDNYELSRISYPDGTIIPTVSTADTGTPLYQFLPVEEQDLDESTVNVILAECDQVLRQYGAYINEKVVAVTSPQQSPTAEPEQPSVSQSGSSSPKISLTTSTYSSTAENVEPQSSEASEPEPEPQSSEASEPEPVDEQQVQAPEPQSQSPRAQSPEHQSTNQNDTISVLADILNPDIPLPKKKERPVVAPTTVEESAQRIREVVGSDDTYLEVQDSASFSLSSITGDLENSEPQQVIQTSSFQPSPTEQPSPTGPQLLEDNDDDNSIDDIIDDLHIRTTIAYVDRPLTSVTEEDVKQSISQIEQGANIKFIPRVSLCKEPIIDLPENIFIDLYEMVRNDIEILPVPQEIILEIQEFFGGYDIKTLVATFELEELYSMLHIDIQDQSPTGLYDGLYKMLYLYKLYLNLTNTSESRSAALITIHLIYLASSYQRIIAREIDDKQDEEKVSESGLIKEKSVELKTNLLLESNQALSEFLSQIIFDTDIKDPTTGQKLKGFGVIEYLCKLGKTDSLLPLAESRFAKVAGLEGLSLSIKPQQIHLYSNAVELFPNVVGLLHNIYCLNQKSYAAEQGVLSISEDEIPESYLADGIDYNDKLAEVKNSPKFKSFTNLSTFEPLSEVANMNLQITHIILPQIATHRGKAPIGLICIDRNNVNVTQKYFIPTVGTFIDNLNDLNVSFTHPIKISRKAYEMGAEGHATLIRVDRSVMEQFGAKLMALPIDNSDEFNLSYILSKLVTLPGMMNMKIPRFVLNNEESVLQGYGLFKLGKYRGKVR